MVDELEDARSTNRLCIQDDFGVVGTWLCIPVSTMSDDKKYNGNGIHPSIRERLLYHFQRQWVLHLQNSNKCSSFFLLEVDGATDRALLVKGSS